jgi:hypothetical protein
MAVGTFTALYQAQFPFLLFIVPINYYIKAWSSGPEFDSQDMIILLKNQLLKMVLNAICW